MAHFFIFHLLKENFLYIFSAFGAVLALKSDNPYRKQITVAFATLFIFFSFMSQKEMRFLIILMPYMLLLAAFSLINIYGRFRKFHAREFIAIAIIISFVFSSFSIIR